MTAYFPLNTTQLKWADILCQQQYSTQQNKPSLNYYY